MEIENFPNEILMKIVGFLPSYKNVSIVSSRFYNIACAVNNKIVLCVDKRLMEDIRRLESIQDTKRTISVVIINFDHLMENEVEIVISIITKFSKGITLLEISGEVSESAFRTILSMVPNAEQLNLSLMVLSKRRQCNESNHEVLSLERVKIMSLCRCDAMLQSVLFRLPPGVLTDLRLTHGFNLYELIENGLFERQRNIKCLVMFTDTYRGDVTADFLDNLQLETFVYNGQHIKNIETALSRQTELNILVCNWDLRVYPPNYPINQDLLAVVTKHLTKLERLSVSLRNVESVANIQKLTKLKHLTLDRIQQDSFDIFTMLDNSRLIILKFFESHYLSSNGISALAKSAPNLRKLTYYKKREWNAVLESFNFVENLKVYVSAACDSEYLNQYRSVNPKLTRLKIITKENASYGTRLLEKLIADYPNLKKFSTDLHTFVTSSEFRLIVDGFQKLELLTLRNVHELTLDDFYYLRDRKRNLKVVYLTKVNLNLITNHMTDIASIFNVVNVCERDHLYMFDEMYHVTVKHMQSRAQARTQVRAQPS